MKPVTICLPYYENEGVLREQLKRFAKLPGDLKRNLRLIVVDDGTTAPKPEKRKIQRGAWLEDIGFPYSLYRITVDVRWNQDAARNIAVRHAETEWLLLTDIDHIPPEKTLRACVEDEHERTKVYRFSRVDLPDLRPRFTKSGAIHIHPNSWLMTKTLYWNAGGYDERFAGLYGTDADFRDRVVNLAGQPIMLESVLIRVPREVIPDASTTTYERKTDKDVRLGEMIRNRNLTPGWKPQHFRFPYEKVEK